MSRTYALLISGFLSAGFLATGCVPKREVTIEEVPSIKKLDDLMAAQSTIADPQFKKRDQATFTDAELTNLVDVSAKIQATSLHIKDFSKGAGFDALAVKLHDDAAALGTAASAKDAAGVRASLTAMKNTCKECHKQFR